MPGTDRYSDTERDGAQFAAGTTGKRHAEDIDHPGEQTHGQHRPPIGDALGTRHTRKRRAGCHDRQGAAHLSVKQVGQDLSADQGGAP